MKKILMCCLCILLFSSGWAQETDEKRAEVMLETTMGNMRLSLFNETPIHRDNFLKLVREGFYDGLLFHRVIYNFMVQTGDPDSRKAVPGALLGSGGPDYTLPAEIRFPQLYHRRGMLSMAREADEVNPERASSASQFFIVTGRFYMREELRPIEARVKKATNGEVEFTKEIRDAYFDFGGAPALDGQYTVFGEVLEGMDIVSEMQLQPTDENDRPKEDIRILRATVVE